jgi:GNAT superfamily N-acetyltransferase
VRVLPADTLEPARLRELFNEGFSDYLVPLWMDAALFSHHLRANDVDLACSQVVVADRPAAFALLARRGDEAWVGGMGTAPSYRRRGLGERALVAGIEAAEQQGCRVVWLEVLDGNGPAIRLYEKLGFAVARDLVLWSLPARPGAAPAGRHVEGREAGAWIAAHRPSREPWQRADESLAAMAPLRGLFVDRDDEPAGAVVYREQGEEVNALQVAARDASAAADALLAAAAGRRLRLLNAPAGEPPSQALRELGADVAGRQHEMRLAIEQG